MRILFIGGLLFLLGSQLQAQSIEKRELIIRLMCYNVHNGKGVDGIQDYHRIGEFIREMNPDVVALQELDSATVRSGKYDVLAEIASHTNMYRYYAPTIDYQGGKYGIGLLAKEQPLRWYQIGLPGEDEQRTALIAEFKTFIFCCTHFSMCEDDRLKSVEILKKEFKNAQKPLFIAGDLNAEPEDRVMKCLTKEFSYSIPVAIKSCPADKPSLRIDYILHRFPKHIKGDVCDGGVIEKPYSEHFPLWIDVSLNKK